MARWFDDAQWDMIQHGLPIFCIDVLPIRRSDVGWSEREVGLILRDTPHQGKRWCLIGGRLRFGETIAEGMRREWASALAESLPWERDLLRDPLLVEYAQDGLPGRPHDPRRHAVCVNQIVETDGEIGVRGDEALDFKWFPQKDLTAEFVGFGQEYVIWSLLELLEQGLSSTTPKR